MQDNERRTLDYKNKKGDRYWWYRRCHYTPPVFSFLTDEEWRLMDAWHAETEGDYARECSVPPISFLLGLVMGNNIRRIVQLGHYTGFSALLLGFMLRKMGGAGKVYSVDIDARLSAFTEKWIAKAGLSGYVNIAVADSAARKNIRAARACLGGSPQLVFIDSSHQYAHTVEELDLWYPQLQAGGFIVLHDISMFSRPGDATGQGGVYRAASEWLAANHAAAILINSGYSGGSGEELVYVDECGLGLIQKPLGALGARPRSASKSLSMRARLLSRLVNMARWWRGRVRRR